MSLGADNPRYECIRQWVVLILAVLMIVAYRYRSMRPIYGLGDVGWVMLLLSCSISILALLAFPNRPPISSVLRWATTPQQRRNLLNQIDGQSIEGIVVEWMAIHAILMVLMAFDVAFFYPDHATTVLLVQIYLGTWPIMFCHGLWWPQVSIVGVFDYLVYDRMEQETPKTH